MKLKEDKTNSNQYMECKCGNLSLIEASNVGENKSRSQLLRSDYVSDFTSCEDLFMQAENVENMKLELNKQHEKGESGMRKERVQYI